jgi:2-keto-4-pentenoate hydratase
MRDQEFGMSEMSGAREAQLLEAVNLFLDARRTGTPLADLPAELAPATEAEAFFIQDRLALSYGEIGGWKIGAPTPEATPLVGPMIAAWMAPGGSVIQGRVSRYRGLEAEIAFLLGEDLPLRANPYSRDEVIAAVASCHPVIEVLESSFEDPTKVPRLSMIADLQMHGGFIYGPAYPDWKSVNFTQERVVLAVDGSVRVERTGSNTSGDFLRLLPYLANETAPRTGGLKAGQWITTGSWTGNTLASAGSSVDVQFSTVGRVTTRFE